MDVCGTCTTVRRKDEEARLKRQEEAKSPERRRREKLLADAEKALEEVKETVDEWMDHINEMRATLDDVDELDAEIGTTSSWNQSNTVDDEGGKTEEPRCKKRKAC